MSTFASHPQKRAPRRSASKGFSLVEILVSALLLSIGMLAMVGLQASALRLTKEAQFRNTASDLAAAFAASVKSNVAGAQANGYNYTVEYSPANGPIEEPEDCRGTEAGIAATCTPVQIAADDVARWRNTARLSLPGGSLFAQTGAVAGGGPTFVDLWVIWRVPQADDAQDAATAQIANNCPAGMGGNQNGTLQCLPVRIFL